MPKICYEKKTFRSAAIEQINRVNLILEEYAGQGFDLTVRQIYYQFVSRDWLKNTLKEYKKLASVINDARLAGLIDWGRIVDRTRFVRALSHWNDPAEIIDSAANSYREDLWAAQEHRLEVWIEKDALVGVIEGVCQQNDVPFFSCRGYTSQSEMWGAAQRLNKYCNIGQDIHIIHLGDHDPSGIDMTRDITDRMKMFLEGNIKIHRIALNMNQVKQYNPPPNPAKITDSRSTGYISKFGGTSWELDALSPTVIAELIQEQILLLRDSGAWEESLANQKIGKSQLEKTAKHWTKIAAFVKKIGEK